MGAGAGRGGAQGLVGAEVVDDPTEAVGFEFEAVGGLGEEEQAFAGEERRASEQPAADELVARFELRKELLGALDSLNQSSHETILLRYFEGLAPRDIARRQGTPVATVKKRLRRGLEQLRETLDKRTGGDRATCMSAVTALVAPVDSDVVTGSLVIGGMAMGTMMKVSAAVLVAAAGVYFVTQTPQAESPRMATVEPPATDVELQEPIDAELVSALEGPATEAGRRRRVAEAPVGVAAAIGSNVLRMVLEGITEEDARMARVTLTGVHEQGEWPAGIRDSWRCHGLTSEFVLGPFLASVERHEDLRALELVIEVDHPLHLLETTRVPLSSGVERENGQSVYEVLVRLVPAGVIHGRLARSDGAPVAMSLVGGLALEGGFPIADIARSGECAADGASELRMRASGLLYSRHELCCARFGCRPHRRTAGLMDSRRDDGRSGPARRGPARALGLLRGPHRKQRSGP